MGFPNNIANKVLVDCERCCSICHKFCGTKIELHHIKQVADGGTDTYENCIALCFDCHAEVKAYNPKHPKGKKYSEKELCMQRDNWCKKVLNSAGVIESSEYIRMDIITFAEFRELLSAQKVPFLYHYNYYSDFDIEIINAINIFIDRCYCPDFEFINSDMEHLKQNLRKEFSDFLVMIDRYTILIMGKYYINDIKNNEVTHHATLTIKSIYDDIIKLGRRKYKTM